MFQRESPPCSLFTPSLFGSACGGCASPEDYLDSMIFSRGYSTKRYASLECAYYNEPTRIQEASYSPYILGLIKQDDVPSIRTLMQNGLSTNPSNYFGDTLAHYVCRLGKAHILKVMIECRCDVRVSDGAGSTPLHEVCRREKPAFDVIDLLAQCDIRMFHLTDGYGDTPMACIPKCCWDQWNAYIDANKDTYWPVRKSHIQGYEQKPPPLTLLPPNSRPTPNPTLRLKVDTILAFAKGTLKPHDIDQSMILTSSSSKDRHSAKRYSREQDYDDDDDDETLDTRDLTLMTNELQEQHHQPTGKISFYGNMKPMRLSGLEVLREQTSQRSLRMQEKPAITHEQHQQPVRQEVIDVRREHSSRIIRSTSSQRKMPDWEEQYEYEPPNEFDAEEVHELEEEEEEEEILHEWEEEVEVEEDEEEILFEDDNNVDWEHRLHEREEDCDNIHPHEHNDYDGHDDEEDEIVFEEVAVEEDNDHDRYDPDIGIESSGCNGQNNTCSKRSSRVKHRSLDRNRSFDDSLYNAMDPFRQAFEAGNFKVLREVGNGEVAEIEEECIEFESGTRKKDVSNAGNGQLGDATIEKNDLVKTNNRQPQGDGDELKVGNTTHQPRSEFIPQQQQEQPAPTEPKFTPPAFIDTTKTTKPKLHQQGNSRLLDLDESDNSDDYDDSMSTISASPYTKQLELLARKQRQQLVARRISFNFTTERVLVDL